MTEKNELQNVEVLPLVPEIVFEPAKFDIVNLDSIKEQVNGLVEKTNRLNVTAENKDVANDWRKTLDEYVKKISRARIDAQTDALKNYTPKANEIKTLENEMKKASSQIKGLVKVFDDEEAERVARERSERIKGIIEEGTKDTGVSVDKIIWDQKWTKNATWKSIGENVAEQVENLQAKQREYQAQKDTIIVAAETLGIDPDGYIDLIDTFSLIDINNKMKQAKARKEQAAEKARLAEEAKNQVNDDLVLDPQQMQREVDEENAAKNEVPSQTIEPTVTHEEVNAPVQNVEKPVETVENTEQPKKDKYVLYKDITVDQWKMLNTFARENGILMFPVDLKKKQKA